MSEGNQETIITAMSEVHLQWDHHYSNETIITAMRPSLQQ